MTRHEEQLSLLLFLNSINKRVLNSLKGEFFRNAKNKYDKVLKASEAFENEVLTACDPDAKKVFDHFSFKMAEVLNVAIEHYNAGNLDVFVEYCETLKID